MNWLVELPHQAAVEGDAVFEQPVEGGAVHHGEPRIAQGHDVIAPVFVLQHAALAEPGAGHHAGEGRSLAAAGDDAHPRKTADHAVPIIETIAAHENVLVGAERFLGDPHARDIDLPVTKFERPGRDASQVIRSDQAALWSDTLSEESLNVTSCCIAQISAYPPHVVRVQTFRVPVQ